MADTPKSGRLERTPPHAPDIERAVLGAMLIDKKSVGDAIELIPNSTFFYEPANGMIFRAITDLFDENAPVDQFTVSERLKGRGQLDMVGGEETIAALIAETASSANIRYHCQILKEKALLRQLISLSVSTRNSSFQDGADATNIIEEMEKGIIDISEMRHSKSYMSVADTVREAHDEIVRKSEAGDGLTGVDSGYSRLNKMTGGWQPSDLIILAGRPSMGKTALGLDLAKNAARNGVPVGIFSLEMSTKQLVMRMLFNEGRFNGSQIHDRKPSQQDWTRLSDACGRLNEYPIYIDDTPGLSITELNAKANRLKVEKNIGLLMVDYLQLMTGSTKESRQQEISQISRTLKGIAKELNIPVIALSQLSRALEQRGGDHRPMLSDLRESGAIEQDADVVMFIYRASVYNLPMDYMIDDQHVSTEDVAEVIIRKQRNGPIGTILLHWIKEYTRFEEFAYQSTGEYI